MALLTVPGADFTDINLTSAFFNPQGQPLAPLNAPLAQAIANFLDSLVPIDPMLNVQTYTPGTTPAALASDVNQLVVPSSLSGGTVFTPPGYTFVVDGTSGASFTVVGAQNFLGGSGNLTVYDTVGAASVGGGIDTITAGDGNDLFGLIPGSTYTVAGGNGNDTFYANGTGAVADGTGSNLIFADGTSNLVLSFGTSDTVIAGAGANTVSTNGTDPLVWGGSGSLEVFGNGATNATVLGGTGPETIFGAQSGEYLLGPANTLFVGSASVGSSETVFGGTSSGEVFNNSSSLVFIAGTNKSTTIAGGSTPSTLFGAAGSSLTYYSTTSGAQYFAGAGNETLNAASATTNVTLFGGQDTTSGNSLVGGAGSDALISGSGSDTMTGGAGDNTFVFNKGAAGGNDFITDYNANDTVGLFGYGGGAGAAALATATVAGGSTTIALSDNTKITFENITTPSSIKIFST